MTSKISFFKLLKEDLHRRSWLFAMTALVLFIAQPVALMISIGNKMEDVRNHYLTMEKVAAYYAGQIGFESAGLMVIVSVVAAVSAFTGYQYLHSKVKLDFYHSLSIKRIGLFFTQYVSGIVLYVVPAIICMLLALAIGGVNGLLTSAAVLVALKAFIVHVLYYLLIYATAILAMMMTGKMIVAILGFGVFLSYGVVTADFIFTGLVSKFFSSAVSTGGAVDGLKSYFSPLTFGFVLEGKLGNSRVSVGEKWLCFGILLLLVLAITVLCVGLYSIRKTESADHSMAFSKTEKVIKFLLVVPISIGVGFYISGMAAAHSFVWFLSGAVFGCIVSSVLIEFIYHMDIREVFGHKFQLILTVIVSVGIILSFRYDIFGYDTYIPEKEDISEMAVHYEPINGSYSYKIEVTENGSSSYYGELYGLEESAVKDFEPIYEMAQEGIKWVKDESRYDQEMITIRYVLKSGRNVYRRYFIPKQSLNEQMERLYDKAEFKEAVYPLLRDSERAAGFFRLSDWNGFRELNLTKEQRDELLETYREELKAIAYQQLLDDEQIAVLSVEFKEEDWERTGLEEKYPITQSCIKTLALLKEFQYEVPMKPDADKISSITVSGVSTGVQAPTEVNFTDKEEISRILESTVFGNFLDYNSVGSERDPDFYITVVFENSNSLWGNFSKEKVPDFVKERLSSVS